LAARAAATIEKELGVTPSVVIGGMGEFSVLADDEVILKKGVFGLPSEAKIVEAVRKSLIT
jgi:hypothetical protein